MSGNSGIQKQLRDDDTDEAGQNALSIVSEELLETIRNSQLALEDCIEGRGGSASLARSEQLLHQVGGALRMTETYGAALLTEEMEGVCRHLAKIRTGQGREDGLEALTRAMVQLPIYIERLLAGGRDIALVLLPMLNDLRAARGQPLLSESTLLLLNLSPSGKKSNDRIQPKSTEDPVKLAGKLRPKFQLALLGWIKGGDSARYLKTLSEVVGELEAAANRDDMHQLWWVAGGLLESLQNGGLKTSIALKRLLGQTDRQMKRLIDEGPEAFDSHPVTDLLNNLLYYVARSSNAGPRISEIRAAFNLSDLLPGDEQVEQARENLAAPSAKLMQTVGSAIKEDIGRVKDVLDIYVRTGMNKSSDLVPQLDLLKKISDTLGVLGLGRLRGDIEAEIEHLKEVVTKGGVADEQTILEIASTLLKVEDQLDHQLVRLILPSETPEGDAEPAPDDEENADFKSVAGAVMRESIINLARIKETFSQGASSSGDSAGIDSVPSLIQGIKAGLTMLDKTRAVDVVDRAGELLVLALSGSGPSQLTPKETDRLADAIVSIEYYMETVKAGRREPWYMLDNAEACLSVLDDLATRLKAVKTNTQTQTQLMKSPDFDDAALQAAVADADKNMRATEIMPLTASVVASDAEHLDPELLELFIEEAKEEIATIKRHLPQWIDSPDDMESLITVRRSFHTLKGSGRMVGAERIGEYCWTIEALLNKLINRTLVRTPPMIEFIGAAVGVVPELVEELEVGDEPTSDVVLFMTRANAFADGDPNASVLTVPTPEVQQREEVPALEMDPVLLDIFSKETAGHLSVIADYLEACNGVRPPYQVSDKLYRACHTLHGSANMANVERGIAVAGALNRFVRRVYDYRIGFQQSGLGALKAAAQAIEGVVADINQAGGERPDFATLIGHIQNLTNTIEAPEENVKPDTVEVESIEESVLLPEEEAYDVEIAAIFSEEAAELLESADQALANWIRDKNGREYVEELKRHLHTLKGGARMAGITAMGNLSHELETLLIGIDGGRVQSVKRIDELLQQSIDEMHRMRDDVIAGKRVTAAAGLEQQIHAINAGGAEAEVALQQIGEATRVSKIDTGVSVEFTIEPEDTVSMVIVDTPIDEDSAELATFEIQEEQPEEPDASAEIEQPEVTADKSPEPSDPVTEPDLEEVAKPAPAADVEVVAKARSDDAPRKAKKEKAGDAAKKSEQHRSQRKAGEQRQEFARIDAELLEELLNAAGEISIYHARLSKQVNTVEFHVEELDQTVLRLREQLRKLEIETEAQIMHGHQETLVAQDFDPLEMDRYSKIQQLSRALAETASDMASLKDLLQSVTSDAESLLVQQARVTAELQDGLMRARMVPFQQHVPRLTRLVRQAAKEAGKRAELAVEGASGELDRQVLEKMLPPFEHMMRNAVIHGIESTDVRQSAGKPAVGRMTIRLHREGAEMVVDISDDGAGLDVDSIRRKAYELDLLKPDAKVSEEEIMNLILTPGFSTASKVTQTAGRGVGMDVVANEIKKLGGSLQISSVTGQGTNFTVRLPFTLAIAQALIVRTGEEVYALPLQTVEGVVRIARPELETILSQNDPSFEYGEQTYRFRHLGMYLGGPSARLPEEETHIPVILVRSGEDSAALLTDEMLLSQEIVVKTVGPQLSSVRGIAGATILGDGSVVLILDIAAIVRGGPPVADLKNAAPTPTDSRPLVMVVDDSITVRRVTERFLERNGMRVITAKDGLDAISVLRDQKPEVILLDIEMPRMDGYEFASHVRNDARMSDVPIIMITSRVGDKHRARAIELGVNDYLGKPFQDSKLLESISRLLEERGVRLE